MLFAEKMRQDNEGKPKFQWIGRFLERLNWKTAYDDKLFI